MPSLTLLGFKVPMPCRTPNGHEWARPTPTPSVKHGGLTHSVKHGGKIALVENKTRSTPWWKTKWVRPPGGKQNFAVAICDRIKWVVKLTK
jgi:hypothetical protein